MTPRPTDGGLALSHDATRPSSAAPARRDPRAVALVFFSRFADLASDATSVHHTHNAAEITGLRQPTYTAIANSGRLNGIRRINKFLEAVNGKLVVGGRYMGCVETAALRVQRHRARYTPLIAHIYVCLDWIFARAAPKLPGMKQLYFWITNGRNRVLTLTEVLGRVYCCGFTLEHMEEHEGLLFFSAIKERAPAYDTRPSYGLLFGQRRIGRDGKEIVVWKVRTMHAYAEYLQQYVYDLNQLDTGGKIKNDFRISPLGRVLRAVWIDELPMVWNLLNGDVKLVGVRPVSRHYFSLLSEELRDRRPNYKPGLIPPYYADLPKTLDECVACELRYFDDYDRSPLLTDMRYLLLILRNIVLRGSRSR